MSETVFKALLNSKDTRVEETAKFIGMVDKFFDCLNVTHINNGRRKKKSFQSPYRKPDDFRLKVYLTVQRDILMRRTCKYIYAVY